MNLNLKLQKASINSRALLFINTLIQFYKGRLKELFTIEKFFSKFHKISVFNMRNKLSLHVHLILKYKLYIVITSVIVPVRSKRI